MKKWKRLLCALLALGLLLSFAACGGKGEEKKDEKSPTEAAEEVVTEFFDAAKSHDLNQMKELLDDDVLIDDYDKMIEEGVSMVISSIPTGLTSGYESDYQKIFEKIIEAIFGEFDYSITDSKEKDDKVTVTVDTRSIDGDATGEAMQTEVTEKMESSEILQGMNKAEAAGYSADEIYAYYAPDVVSIYQEAVDDAIKNPEIKEKKAKFVVYQNDDGEWVIDAEKSDLDDVLGEDWFK